MSPGKARVSLCMIVRDEEKNLADCLRPVADLFAEIVIVDTGSRDNTRQIARQFTPHVLEFEWCDDYSAARNAGLRQATGDWIFWLDADDRIPPTQVDQLKRLFERLDERPRAYFMDTRLIPAVAGEEPSFVTHRRLFRRHPAVQWKGRVHEQLTPDLSTLGYECLFSEIVIDHVGYQELALAERKRLRKLRLLRMDYAVDPDDPSTLLHLGIALRKSSNGREARRCLQRLVQQERGPAPCLRWVFDALASVAIEEGQPHEGLHWAKQGLALFPDDEDLLLQQAMAEFVTENYGAATATLRQIMAAAPAHRVKYGSLGDVRTKRAPLMLGAIQRMQGDYRAAEATLRQVLADFPECVDAWFSVGLVHLDVGNGTALTLAIMNLQKIAGGTNWARQLAALWHLRHGDPALAGPLIDDLIAQAPQLPQPRILRVEWLSKMREPIERQIRALRDVLRVQPGNLEARQWLKKAECYQAAAAQSMTHPCSNSIVAMPGITVG